MNRRKMLLLRFLLNNCSEGYKVIETKVIFEKNPKYKGNFTLLEEDFEFLKKYKFVDVKYLDEVNVCVAIMDNSYIFQDNLKSDRSLNRRNLITIIISMLFSGFMAFIGAFLAIIITR